MTDFGFVHLLFYSLIFALYVYAYIYDTALFTSQKYAKVGFPFDDSYGRRAKFLTYINMAMQTAYFGFGALMSFGSVICSRLCSCCTKKDNQKSSCGCVQSVQDFFTFMHASLIFPIGMVYLYDFVLAPALVSYLKYDYYIYNFISVNSHSVD